MSYLLLATVVLSWGFSWFAITLQVSHVPAIVAIAYRFTLAAAILLIWLAMRGRLNKIPSKDHLWLAGLGACLFSLNFFFFYQASHYLPSGLLSVVFASAAIVNAVNQRLFLGVALDRRVMLAALIGVIGLALLIGPQMQMGQGMGVWIGTALALVGTYCFSLGNLISARLSQSHSVSNMVAQGMVYGALIATGLGLAGGQRFSLPEDPVFWAALVFLAVISSVLGFLTYLNLVKREGPSRAAYATVLFPVVAMVLSGLLEGYEWSPSAVLGLCLTLTGTFVVFSRKTS